LRSPLEDGPLIVLEEVDSTQTAAAKWLRGERDGPIPGAIVALSQTRGKGRFGREWISTPGDSLAMSLVFRGNPLTEKPWLLGMAVALAAAEAFNLNLAWPNDLLIGGKKIGGVLTEILGQGVPVVGIGINLNQAALPEEIRDFATSLVLAGHNAVDPFDAARLVLAHLATVPEPHVWRDLEPIWAPRDATKGKRYRLPNGLNGVAKAIGAEGELEFVVDGQVRTVLAAEAILGASTLE
jgi:BirA family biotin operon repressor/biotin-[acetyl-CoA-carboxylase] ligase